MRTSLRLTLPALALIMLTTACGSDSVLDPAFEPEVVNTPNVVFSFQATGVQDVSDVVSYTWNVSSGNVIVHPSTSTTSGTITLNIKDAAGTVVFDGTVPASGDITPPAGAPGAWIVTVTLADYTGTINFAVQML